MPGKTSDLSPLESQKQLLVAESELNRAGLAEEWQAMAHGVRDFAHRAKNIAAWASAAALVVAGITALRRDSTRSGTVKSSWFQKILKGASLVSSLWPALRTKSHDHENNQPTSRA
jgi:hypothetical protein